jgi:uncharacterized membrane protein HdeD (DUF308 family)
MSSQHQASDPDHRADAGAGAGAGAGSAPGADTGPQYTQDFARDQEQAAGPGHAHGTAPGSAHGTAPGSEHERRESRQEPPGPINYLVRRGWQGLLVTGVAAIVLGSLVLAWPGETLVVVGVLFGVYLVVTGVFQLFTAFGTHGGGGMRALAFISGALSIVLGLFCFRGTLESIFLLAIWIGIGWLFRGISLAMASFSDPAMPARGWQGFVGVVSALAGVVLMVSPFRSIAVLTLVAGLWLIVLGFSEVFAAFRVRNRAKDLPHRL